MSATAATYTVPKMGVHPLKRIKTFGLQFIAGHMGIFTIVALYYVFFQTTLLSPLVHLFGSHQSMKQFWDTLLTVHIPVFSDAHWTYWRHLIRNDGEYFLGTMLALQIVYNPYKREKKLAKKASKITKRLNALSGKLTTVHVSDERNKLHAKLETLGQGSWLDRLEIKAHIINLCQKRPVSAWQLMAAPLLAFFVYAMPGYFTGWGLAQGLKHLLHAHTLTPYLGHHPSFVAKLYAGNLDQHLIGVLSGFFAGRRPMKPAFAYIQRYFAERRRARNKKAHFWHPMPYQMLVKHLWETQTQTQAQAAISRRGTAIPWLMSIGLVILIGLSAFGYHILHDIAK